LMTQHNLSFYQARMQAMREVSAGGAFASAASDFRRNYLRK